MGLWLLRNAMWGGSGGWNWFCAKTPWTRLWVEIHVHSLPIAGEEKEGNALGSFKSPSRYKRIQVLWCVFAHACNCPKWVQELLLKSLTIATDQIWNAPLLINKIGLIIRNMNCWTPLMLLHISSFSCSISKAELWVKSGAVTSILQAVVVLSPAPTMKIRSRNGKRCAPITSQMDLSPLILVEK